MPSSVDLHWEHHFSKVEWSYICSVSPHKRCHLKITNSEQSSSGKHKLKLTAFMLLPFHRNEALHAEAKVNLGLGSHKD